MHRSISTTWHARRGCAPTRLVAMPEVSADHRTFTFRIRPGIYFQDDPAFNGKPRELVAADYVYSWKRIYDPRWKSPMLFVLENSKVARPDRAARRRAEGPPPVRLHDRGRRTAHPRPVHLPLRLAEPNPALALQLRRRIAVRCGRARSGRGLRRRHHGASGRHRPVPARRLATLLAYRPRAQSCVSRAALRASSQPTMPRQSWRPRWPGCAAAACR